MKKNYFILFLCFAVLGLIFAFENISTATRVLILFKTTSQSLFYTITFSTIIGIISGFFLGLSLSSKGKSQTMGGRSDIDL